MQTELVLSDASDFIISQHPITIKKKGHWKRFFYTAGFRSRRRIKFRAAANFGPRRPCWAYSICQEGVSAARQALLLSSLLIMCVHCTEAGLYLGLHYGTHFPSKCEQTSNCGGTDTTQRAISARAELQPHGNERVFQTFQRVEGRSLLDAERG